MKNVLLTSIIVFGLIYNSVGQNITQTADHQIGDIMSIKIAQKDSSLNLPPDNAGDAVINSRYKKQREAPWFVERFKVSVGGFLALNNTDIEVNGSNGNIGTNINFENDLGFNKYSTTFLGDIQWRASSRSRFDISYIGISRSADYTLQKTVQFGNHTYDVDATVSAFFNTNITRFSYGYAILSTPTYEAGLLIGAHVVKISTGIGANGANFSGGVSDDFGVTAPLPDFGIWGGVALGPNWALNGEFDYLSLTIDGITGRILAYNGSVSFRPIHNLSFTAGYTGLNFTVDAVRNKFDGYLKWGYNGPTLTATFSFGRKSWK